MADDEKGRFFYRGSGNNEGRPLQPRNLALKGSKSRSGAYYVLTGILSAHDFLFKSLITMVPPDWIEQSTPSLPMTCSTTELWRPNPASKAPRGSRPCSGRDLAFRARPCHSAHAHARRGPAPKRGRSARHAGQPDGATVHASNVSMALMFLQ